MFPQNLRWVLLAVAAVGCSASLDAAISSDTAPNPSKPESEVKVAGGPIPQTADAHNTALDFKRQYLEWCKRTMLPSLQAAAKGQAWEAEALSFVEDALTAWNGLESGDRAKVWRDLAARGDALVKGGCEEPTVLFFAARFKVKGGRNKGEIAPRYRRALELLEGDARYRKAFACIVAVNLDGMLQAPSAELNRKILDLRKAGFEEGSYSGADDAFFVDQILNNNYDPLRDDLEAKEKLANETKGLPEWARDTILGNIEIARGWKARGSGYSDSVTEKMGKEYREWLDKARGHLEAAWKLRPGQPYAAADMIRVAMDSGPGSAERARLWFDRTVRARFDYVNAYNTYKFSLLPRWGGSYQQMVAFGLACARTERYETDVPREFSAALDQISGDSHERRGIFEIPEIARALVAVDKGYIAALRPTSDRKAFISNLVLDAWLGRQWDEGKKALDQIPDQNLSPSTISRAGYFGGDANQMVGEILINTSAAREEYAKARELEKQGHYDEAAARYPAVLKASGGEPAVKEFIASLTRIDTARGRLENGQWTDISPKTMASSGWGLPRTARWSLPREGALEVDGIGQSTMARWRTPVGENYELRATIEFLETLQVVRRFFIVLGINDRHPDEAILCNIFTEKSPPKGKARLLRGYDVVANPDYDVDLQKKNRVQIQCWHGQLSLYLNGKAVFEKVKSVEGNPSDPDGEIGVGAYGLPQGENFEVTEIAVRVLKAPPTPPDGREDK